MAAAPAAAFANGMARAVMRAANATGSTVASGVRLVDCMPREIVDDIFSHALKKQTGVSLKYMLDFGANPIERQLILSAQFLHRELPVRLAHRVAELENLPYGLSTKSRILKVRCKPSMPDDVNSMPILDFVFSRMCGLSNRGIDCSLIIRIIRMLQYAPSSPA